MRILDTNGKSLKDKLVYVGRVPADASWDDFLKNLEGKLPADGLYCLPLELFQYGNTYETNRIYYGDAYVPSEYMSECRIPYQFAARLNKYKKYLQPIHDYGFATDAQFERTYWLHLADKNTICKFSHIKLSQTSYMVAKLALQCNDFGLVYSSSKEVDNGFSMKILEDTIYDTIVFYNHLRKMMVVISKYRSSIMMDDIKVFLVGEGESHDIGITVDTRYIFNRRLVDTIAEDVSISWHNPLAIDWLTSQIDHNFIRTRKGFFRKEKSCIVKELLLLIMTR